MEKTDEYRIDLESYFRRIGYTGERHTSLAVLKQLHLAHVDRIPFENLDVLLGRAILLDLPRLEAKLVHGRRGGYCFEQNMLFAAVLEDLGFSVTRLAARVRSGTTRLLPRTHMLLKVDVRGDAVIADVGFGGDGLLEPIMLEGEPTRQFAWEYRIAREADLYVVQSLRDQKWDDLYAFNLEPQFPVDFQVANHYVSTHPSSRFVQTLTVQRPTSKARYILRNREFIVQSGPEDNLRSTRIVKDDQELLDVLDGTFGLEFPRETQFLAALAGRVP